jgi:hypothetical protein
MFAKNKPTERVQFDDGNWVELQVLSKGVKDSLKSELADMYSGLKIENGPDGKPSTETLPPGIVGKVSDNQHRKVAAAIRAWSAEAQITVETVKELDEETFDKILAKVNEMNELTAAEEKN